MEQAVRRALVFGLIGGFAAWHLSLVGLIEAFAGRRLIGQGVTFSYVLLLALMLTVGYLVGRRISNWTGLLGAALAGLLVGLALWVLALLVATVDLRTVFVAASPALPDILTFNRGTGAVGLAVLLLVGAAVGFLGGGLTWLPATGRRAVLTALAIAVLVGLLRDVLSPIFPAPVMGFLFTPTGGLSLPGTATVLALALAVPIARQVLANRASSHRGSLSVRALQRRRVAARVIGVVFLASFPLWAGLFLSNVSDFVGLYILMGLGLNLVLGFAGLLDLGYVAFFAIGAYSMAVLTSPELGHFTLGFWEALPIAVAMTVVSGILIGLPVLRMRGDYLAITTLGFGEIVRLLVLSDWLKPHLGGAQGVTRIARPELGPFVIDRPQEYYYLILIGCGLAWFLSVRLRDSRIGRAWMAIREDEDVAQAMGINRVTAKLLAFATGAAMGGLSGALFASLVNSVIPQSFSLLVSINVVALLVLGGIGSLPGVVVGALALVGLPELLREFQEYRLLVYGVVLVAMMIFRPAGLWPEETRVRELEEAAEEGKTRAPAEVAAVTQDGA
ncbi:leucine/isoleucine/valine transporter permease subunit [Thermomicrobiaceae bacterium CFH 74404]|uniref:Leucine/isoleucine/valine transporter permease subunit n=2 Tax=Thermomicrobia TaxID=189775 RepID=A0AA41WGN4_9BACT|nr:leucine/isoleucine/valine transporter permease subunit [Thermalbibacter longus]MCM8749705.1 leucine/isoleucine/valine transporter permease subunit [Thermalbibacter longus]